MPQLRSSRDVNVDAFMKDGLAVKRHLSLFLDLSLEELERRLRSNPMHPQTQRT